MKFPDRLLSFSMLTLGDPRRVGGDFKLPWRAMAERGVNSTRFFLIFPWTYTICDVAYSGFNLLWSRSLKLCQNKLFRLGQMCLALNDCGIVPILSVFDACGITHRTKGGGWWSHPLNVTQGGFLKQGGKTGLLDFYENHLDFAVGTIQAVINAVKGLTVVIEPMNESRFEGSEEWLYKIRKAIKAPSNIRFMQSDQNMTVGMYRKYDYHSVHGACSIDKISNGWISTLEHGMMVSTDGCRNTGGSYPQGRPGAKQIEPMLRWCKETSPSNPHSVGFEHCCKNWDIKGRLHAEDYKILELFRAYGDKEEPPKERKPKPRRKREPRRREVR